MLGSRLCRASAASVPVPSEHAGLPCAIFGIYGACGSVGSPQRPCRSRSETTPSPSPRRKLDEAIAGSTGGLSG
jgi:hypothetical protein